MEWYGNIFIITVREWPVNISQDIKSVRSPYVALLSAVRNHLVLATFSNLNHIHFHHSLLFKVAFDMLQGRTSNTKLTKSEEEESEERNAIPPAMRTLVLMTLVLSSSE